MKKILAEYLMAVKSVFVTGDITEDFSKQIWEPEADIRSGIWEISLQKVVIKLSKNVDNQFSFCVKTNLVEQNERDKQGKLNVTKTCLGLFSCHGKKDEEIVLQNIAQFFTITRPENEITITIDNPLNSTKFKKENTEEVVHKVGCFFVYKRVI